MRRFRIASRLITPLSRRIHVSGYGISGIVVAANDRWTVVQEISGRRTAIPTSNCERTRL